MAFLDAWVVDKTMFEYVSKGGCSCCGISSAMINFAALDAPCSDWETDDEDREMFSPWPTFIHEDVQKQRVMIRHRLKQHLPLYASFWAEHGAAFATWWTQLTAATKFRLFQLPEADVTAYVHSHADVHGPYGIVLATVTEQIKHFSVTGYVDGRTVAEVAFERHLQFEKSAFTLAPSYLALPANAPTGFCALLQHFLAGPRLLPASTDETSGDNNDSATTSRAPDAVQSFRSDRRVVRLVLARLLADVVMAKYERSRTEKAT
ncbi:hypothetical protein SPRG_14080 [Saprolegnia parasitica CBS 223.65]|uniref:Uncharacterized protein n=1 Tax=Saprolegnia parasitica (strain CBS 223.65) TaxID=695850 RepID=A0A067BQS2_SAPPC|nr:hypothetical protein SPRG_14080 [Saprolegnia parasitica CBS 223.65]KDO20849.1 hypothetical protein SPRG_14080 [Saprolegnia parasitica CBS 223.65]|eukprot:XP_012208427.1 hypothetical protein SPRG_14080 [Saprolegnia parasitica CBS 223.65]